MSSHLPSLKSECSRCAALCCVALTFDKGPKFAISKEAGTPCPNLGPDHRCTIHADLAERGFQGCIDYDCAGAGQRVIEERFNSEDWRSAPELLTAMMRDFGALRPLHERMLMLEAAGQYALTPDLEERRQKLLKRCARSWSSSVEMNKDFKAFIEDLRPIAEASQ